jgi:hypothetical protein
MLMVSGMVSITGSQRAAHTKAQPDSGIAARGFNDYGPFFISPFFSASSIMATAKPVLDAGKGVERSTLTSTCAPRPQPSCLYAQDGCFPIVFVISL